MARHGAPDAQSQVEPGRRGRDREHRPAAGRTGINRLGARPAGAAGLPGRQHVAGRRRGPCRVGTGASPSRARNPRVSKSRPQPAAFGHRAGRRGSGHQWTPGRRQSACGHFATCNKLESLRLKAVPERVGSGQGWSSIRPSFCTRLLHGNNGAISRHCFSCENLKFRMGPYDNTLFCSDARL